MLIRIYGYAIMEIVLLKYLSEHVDRLVPMFTDMRKINLNGAKEEVMEVHQLQNTIIFLNQIIDLIKTLEDNR